MASVAMLVGDDLVNALAFSGSNYLFSTLRSSGVDEERKRHDKAIEQLQAATSDWSEKRTERLDWMNEQLRRQNHVEKTFRDADAAIRKYAEVFGENKTRDIIGPKPCSPTFIHQAMIKKTARLLSLL